MYKRQLIDTPKSVYEDQRTGCSFKSFNWKKRLNTGRTPILHLILLTDDVTKGSNNKSRAQ